MSRHQDHSSRLDGNLLQLVLEIDSTRERLKNLREWISEHSVRGQQAWLFEVVAKAEELASIHQDQLSVFRTRAHKPTLPIQSGYEGILTHFTRRREVGIQHNIAQIEERLRYLESRQNGSDTNPDSNSCNGSSLLFLHGKKRKWEVPGSLAGLNIAALADTGSRYDVISDTLASELHLDIKRSEGRTLKLPQKGEIHTLGTVTLPFSFLNESDSYSLVFHVVKDCTQKCILGKDFLKKTKTLGKHFATRVKESVIKACSGRFGINLIDAPEERLMGSINGQTIGALADTGAEVNIMSRANAKRLGLTIHQGKEYTVTLEFADGSTTDTVGMVLGAEWTFGAETSSSPHMLDFHIVDDLSCGVILGAEFLYDNQVFSLYEDHFYNELPGVQKSETPAYLYLIILRKCKKTTPASSLPSEIQDELQQVHRTIRAETAPSQSVSPQIVHPASMADNCLKRSPWVVRILRKGIKPPKPTVGTNSSASP